MESKKYQVFLSSTYTDLVDERESIIKAVLEMYHIPIGMEMFSAEDEDQWEIIRRTIEVSDYYILILGLRYGSKTSDGISFTQKEYEYALEKKIPILAFVMDDGVSLSKDKRDDDLSDVNRFRDMVLNNTKMAQFWETKDQLIKSVSISLMKQIMQKPAVGWIRGDSSNGSEALSKELSALSKENRELRERVKELETKISLKAPNIKVDIEKPVIDDRQGSYQKVFAPKKIDRQDIESHLLEYISEEDILSFNESIPSEEVLDLYNRECALVFAVSNHSIPLGINVSNIGSRKASNIYIDIIFSDGIFVYDANDSFDEPMTPIPLSPLIKAQAKYERGGVDNFVFRTNSIVSPEFVSGDIYNSPMLAGNILGQINKSSWVSLDGQKVSLKVDSLLHTRSSTYGEEYMIAPLVKGRHRIDVEIFCEEYEEVVKDFIEFDV